MFGSSRLVEKSKEMKPDDLVTMQASTESFGGGLGTLAPGPSGADKKVGRYNRPAFKDNFNVAEESSGEDSEEGEITLPPSMLK